MKDRMCVECIEFLAAQNANREPRMPAHPLETPTSKLLTMEKRFLVLCFLCSVGTRIIIY